MGIENKNLLKEEQSGLKFSYFPNHGDEEGRNGYTICYGDWENSDEIIVGCEDTEEDAKEAVKRLNGILANIITPLQQTTLQNLNQVIKELRYQVGFYRSAILSGETISTAIFKDMDLKLFDALKSYDEEGTVTSLPIKEEDDLEPSGQSLDGDSVASHSCTDGNSIEQVKERLVDTLHNYFSTTQTMHDRCYECADDIYNALFKTAK